MNKTLIEGIDFYFNNENLMVLTEKYHLEKGFCCGEVCKHCPYDFENVPEPKLSEILNLQTAAAINKIG